MKMWAEPMNSTRACVCVNWINVCAACLVVSRLEPSVECRECFCSQTSHIVHLLGLQRNFRLFYSIPLLPIPFDLLFSCFALFWQPTTCPCHHYPLHEPRVSRKYISNRAERSFLQIFIKPPIGLSLDTEIKPTVLAKPRNGFWWIRGTTQKNPL